MLATVGAALGGLRKAKSEAKVKQRTEVLSAVISGSESQVRQLEAALADLSAAGNAANLELRVHDGDLSVSEVRLAPPEQATDPS
jgi:valyl-tRNA synthetase